jgi:hypothetical protein
MRIYASQYLLVCKNLASEYSLECDISLKFCEYSFQNEYLQQIFASMKNIFVLHQMEYMYVSLCEYFETNMKRMMLNK